MYVTALGLIDFRSYQQAEVQLAPFEAEGLRGQNVIATLRGPGPEFVVLAAHHDSAPDAPGAYDDGGGVGVLLEAARLLALRTERARTLVFVSFDGEESESQRKTPAAGSRAYVQSLGAEARNLVAALNSHQRACCCCAIVNAWRSPASASGFLPKPSNISPRRRYSSASKNFSLVACAV